MVMVYSAILCNRNEAIQCVFQISLTNLITIEEKLTYSASPADPNK